MAAAFQANAFQSAFQIGEQAPEEEVSSPGDGGGGWAVHPDMLPRAKKKKKAEPAAPDDTQAEADFRTLWESVKIRNSPARRAAAEKKRLAVLVDLQKAALIRDPTQR